MERTVNFFPESHAFFNLECMIKGCEEGGFEVTLYQDVSQLTPNDLSNEINTIMTERS